MALDPATLTKFSLRDKELISKVQKRIDQINTWAKADMHSTLEFAFDWLSLERDFSKTNDLFERAVDSDMCDLVYFFKDLKKDALTKDSISPITLVDFKHAQTLTDGKFEISLKTPSLIISGNYLTASINGLRTSALKDGIKDQL